MILRGANLAVALMLVASAAADQIQWTKDLEAAMKSAKASKQLVMIDFYTDWCGWCKRLDRDVWPNSEVVKESARFVMVKLDAEKEGKQAATKYGVRGFPTMLFIEPDGGEVVMRIPGYVPAPRMAETLKRIATQYQDFGTLQAALKAKPDDGELNAKIAAIYAARGNEKEAKAALGRAEQAKYSGPAAGAMYNAVGDLYQSQEQFGEAIELFEKAFAASSDPQERGYAKASIMTCHISSGNEAKAKQVAEEIIKLEGCPQDYVESAKKLLGK